MSDIFRYCPPWLREKLPTSVCRIDKYGDNNWKGQTNDRNKEMDGKRNKPADHWHACNCPTKLRRIIWRICEWGYRHLVRIPTRSNFEWRGRWGCLMQLRVTRYGKISRFFSSMVLSLPPFPSLSNREGILEGMHSSAHSDPSDNRYTFASWRHSARPTAGLIMDDL